jgi:DNA-directed RNA polymerase specialized sigma24 family protein
MQNMTAPDAKSLDAFRRAKWDEIIPRLVLFAERKIRPNVWYSIPGGPLPGGKQAADLVQQAVAKVLRGERVWNRNEPLLRFLMSVISSDINNLAQSRENTKTVRIQHHGGQDAHPTEIDLAFLSDPPPSQRGGDQLINSQVDQERAQILTALSNDRLVHQIASLIIDDGISKPRKLAKILGTDVNKIHNAKKRLRRRLQRGAVTRPVVTGEGRND